MFKKYRTWLILVIIVVAGATVFLYMRNQRLANAEDQYQTMPAEKGQLIAVVGATGTVRSNQSVVLNWQTTGRVDAVNVAVGDTVAAEAILATLAPDSVSQALISARAQLVNAQKALDDLLNPSELMKAQAAQKLVQAQKAFEDAEKKVEALGYKRASDDLIKQTQAKLDLAQQQLSLAQNAYNNVSGLSDGDPIKAQAQLALTNAQLSYNNLKAQMNWYTGKPTDLDAAITQANYDLAKAQLDEAQRTVDKFTNGPDQRDIDAAQAQVDAAQATLDLINVMAPFAGTITDAAPMPGDLVGPQSVAFRLDDLSHLLIDVNVSEIDVTNIQVGQKAVVTFDALVGKQYNAEVVKVGGVGTTVQGVVNFKVTLELTDVDDAIKPGMTASLTLIINQLDDVLLVPNRAVRVLNDERVVYVLKDGAPTPVKIVLGASSDTNSEVVEGELKEGDLIVLNPPSNFGQNGPFGGRPGN